MATLAQQLSSVAAWPVVDHAFMTVAADVAAVDVGSDAGPAYSFTDDIGFGAVIAPGALDHVPAVGETMRLTGGWSHPGADGVSTHFLGLSAATAH